MRGWAGLWLGIIVAVPVAAATPPMGVPAPIRQGVHAEIQTGTFFTVGGSSGVSNAQLFVGAGVGYDILPQLSAGIFFDIGSSAGNCFTPEVDDAGDCVDPGYLKPTTGLPVPLAANFAIVGANVQVRYAYYLTDRVAITPKVIGGAATITPEAVAPSEGGAGDSESFQPLWGAGLGVEYATLLDHFTVGLDAMFRQIVGPGISGFAIYPRLKYTF
jgi:hypothetical protein